MSTTNSPLTIVPGQPPKRDGKRVYLDNRQMEVPSKYLRTIERKQDAFAFKMAKKAIQLADKLKQFKEELFTSADDIYELMQADAHVNTGEVGNYTITSYGKEVKVEVSVQHRIEFDSNITFAKEKIFQYIREKLGDKDDALRKLIYTSFETSRGQLDTKNVLRLMKLKIDHPLWNEGIELIKKSMDVNRSKRYARVFVRDQNGEYKPVGLNFSNI